jgi:hypothetical protein
LYHFLISCMKECWPFSKIIPTTIPIGMKIVLSFLLIYFQNESSLRTRRFLLSSIFVLELYNALDSTNGSLHAQKSWKLILGHMFSSKYVLNQLWPWKDQL